MSTDSATTQVNSARTAKAVRRYKRHTRYGEIAVVITAALMLLAALQLPPS